MSISTCKYIQKKSITVLVKINIIYKNCVFKHKKSEIIKLSFPPPYYIIHIVIRIFCCCDKMKVYCPDNV